MTLAGRIHDDCPIVRARITHGILILGRTGLEQLVVDTGFAGAIALPCRLLRRLALEFVATDTFLPLGLFPPKALEILQVFEEACVLGISPGPPPRFLSKSPPLPVWSSPSAYLHEALVLRQIADYREIEASSRRAGLVLSWAQEFLGRVEEVLQHA